MLTALLHAGAVAIGRALPVCILLACSAAAVAGAAQEPPWSKLRKDHPRLYFNKETFPAVRDRALGPEKAHFAAMKRWVDQAPATPPVADHGPRASAAAFVYLVTRDKAYCQRARALLESSAAYYRQCAAQKRSVNWYSHSRVNAIAAWDWLFSDLTPEQRGRLGRELLDHVEAVQKGGVYRRNRSGYTTGFYGTQALLWYAGLAFHNAGIDDPRAKRYVMGGYDRYRKLLAHRRAMAGDDGGSASATLGYAIGHYPLAELNFFHTMRSAFGVGLAEDWRYPAYFVGWVMWNWISSPEGPMEFGTGDASHRDNRMPLWYMFGHLAQLRHFYGRLEPKCAALARWMQGQLPERSRRYPVSGPYPWYPFLMTRIDQSPEAKPPSELLPPARHFEKMGQIFMRSGSGADDTYALFTAGMPSRQHKHFDENSFTIYKKGHLALDTGSRPEPGIHLSHYYCRTVAHNCVLIQMPGEKMPGYWGSPAPGEGKPPVPNDGGMNKQTGAKVRAFQTCPEFTYLASDATPCYTRQKCLLALRQFVFVPPNHFVIFDCVTARKAEYQKAWLLHAAAEPAIEGDTFHAAYRQGKLYCRTLWPPGARLTKIGGAGRQFWSDGRNWPFPKTRRWAGKDTGALYGQWRVEVSPAEARKNDWFVHLIEVGDRRTLKAMSPAKLARTPKSIGVSFEAGPRRVTVTFDTEKPPGGRIEISGEGGDRLKSVPEALARAVQKQVGLTGLPPK